MRSSGSREVKPKLQIGSPDLPEQAMIIFLDDKESRTRVFRSNVPSACCYRTAHDLIERLRLADAPVAHLFLDHDLANPYCPADGDEYKRSVEQSGPNTGSEVVRWIVANKPAIERITIHSANYL